MLNPIPKFFPENNPNNIIVEVIMFVPNMTDGDTFKCAGVLIKENDSGIRIGFNAKGDQVIDYLDIEYRSILEIKEVSKRDIKIID